MRPLIPKSSPLRSVEEKLIEAIDEMKEDEARALAVGLNYPTWATHRWWGMKVGLKAVRKLYRESPGLVDRTSRCDFCGKPLPAADGYVDWDNTPVLAYDDGSPMYGCPDCAAVEEGGDT